MITITEEQKRVAAYFNDHQLFTEFWMRDLGYDQYRETILAYGRKPNSKEEFERKKQEQQEAMEWYFSQNYTPNAYNGPNSPHGINDLSL